MTFGDPYSSMGFGSGGIVGSFMGLNGGGAGSFNPKDGLIVCNSSDFICGVTPNIGGGDGGGEKLTTSGLGSHLSYTSDGSIAKAVEFILRRVKD